MKVIIRKTLVLFQELTYQWISSCLAQNWILEISVFCLLIIKFRKSNE